jgi:hypothetical protein
METREKEIVARALEAFWRLMSRAIELDRSGAAIDALAALEAAFKEEIAVHRTPPSPQSGGAVELYRRIISGKCVMGYERATEAEAVIEAARTLVKQTIATPDWWEEQNKLLVALSALTRSTGGTDG